MKTVHSLPLGSDMQVGDGYICLGHTDGGSRNRMELQGELN